MSTVDVMLPYYGPAELMRAAVRSVLAQQDPDWRLTVVDDNDPEPGIPEWFASLGDKRIQYLRNERNLGVNRNFQRCVDLAEHDVIVVLGCDDLMLPNYLSSVRAAFAEFPGATIVQPGVRVIDEHGVPARGLADSAKQVLYAPRVSVRTELAGEELAASLLRGNWLYFPSLAWRSSAVRAVGFRKGLHVVQDLALALDLVARGARLVVDPKVCFSYRRHRASVSSWRALNGSRFAEERSFFLGEAARMSSLGWHRAARIARRHTASRLNALTLLPAAIRQRHRRGTMALARHAFGPAVPRE
ncbi:MAG TPA: glycosyltransferase [Pseudonocardiaceae bacterium]|nr:glycosyltransferase [Pseudonocardiaceae bacterium]